MLNSIYKAASNMKDERAAQNEYRKILRESTSHEAWNVSNTKLQVLADHTYNWEDYQVIIKHLWAMLNSRPKEWRRIAKTVHVIDYLIKNGAPRAIQDIKDDLYKIRQFENFTFKENGIEQGVELRDKVKQLCELVNEPGKLQYEREFAKSTREKFQGISSSGHDGIGSVVPTDKPGKKSKSSAAPASGNQYGGFGSEDIAKFGYNDKDKYGDSGAYDPYTNTQSIDTKKEEKEEEKPKKEKEETKTQFKHTLDDDTDSTYSSVDSIDSDNTKKKKKKQKKKKAKQAREKNEKEANAKAGIVEPEQKAGLFMVPKANRSLPGASAPKAPQVAQPVVTPQPAAPIQNNGNDLFDLLNSTPSQPQPVAQNNNQNAFGFMQQPSTQQQNPPQQQANMFGGMDMSNSNQQQQPPVQQQQNQNAFGFVQSAPQQQQQQPQQNAFNFMSTPAQPAPVQQQVQQTTDMFGGLSMGTGTSQTTQQIVIQPVGAATPQQEKKTNTGKSGGLWDDKSSNLFDLSSGGLTVQKKEEPKQQPNLLLSQQSNSTEQMFMNNNSSQNNMMQSNQGGFQTGINPNQLLGQMNMQNNQQQMMQMQQQQRMMMMQQQQQQQQQQQSMMMNNNMNPLAMNNNPLGMNNNMGMQQNYNTQGQVNMQQMNPMQQQMMMQQQQQNQNQNQFNQYNQGQQNQFGQFK